MPGDPESIQASRLQAHRYNHLLPVTRHEQRNIEQDRIADFAHGLQAGIGDIGYRKPIVHAVLPVFMGRIVKLERCAPLYRQDGYSAIAHNRVERRPGDLGPDIGSELIARIDKVVRFILSGELLANAMHHQDEIRTGRIVSVVHYRRILLFQRRGVDLASSLDDGCFGRPGAVGAASPRVISARRILA